MDFHQPDLFDLPPAQRHSPTSVAAAEAIAPRAGSLRAHVYDWLKARGADGGTDEEMQTALQMSPNTQRPRRVELEQLGLVQNSGRTRLTRAGRKAVVWVVT